MAVYTEVTDDELIAFVAGYGIGEVLSCKGIAEGVENSNFLLAAEQGHFILTLYEKRVDPDDLPFFLGLMSHLANKGIPCPTPLKDATGRALGTLAGRPAAIVTFLDGMWPRRITPEHCAELGRAMAELHLAGADFAIRRPNALTLAQWPDLLAACGDGADGVKAGLDRILGDELKALQRLWPAPGALPSGVVHADLFPDNVFFRGAHLSGLIDFYFACNDAFAYDIAICLNAWCFEPDLSFNVTKARRMLTAYRKVRDFSAGETAALPVLARGAALRFLLTRLYDWLNTPEGAMVTRKDPLEYLERLRFHQGLAGPGDYGLD